MYKRKKHTTIALEANQHLCVSFKHISTIVEVYMEGFTDGKRDRSLDGWYFFQDIIPFKKI
jgi:hypothetical protein